MKKTTLLTVIILISALSSAQKVTGIVESQKYPDGKVPLPYATVYWAEGNISVETDAKGKFNFSRKKYERVTLIASYIGFTNDTIVLNKDENYAELILSQKRDMNIVKVQESQENISSTSATKTVEVPAPEPKVAKVDKRSKKVSAQAVEKVAKADKPSKEVSAQASPLNVIKANGGSVFYEQIRTLPIEEREALIRKEILSGNYPQFLRKWVKVRSTEKDIHGVKHKVTLFVAPDYLSVGNDSDLFIMPMEPTTAQIIADSLGASLPTPKIVDLIYKKSKLKLEPFNFIPRGNRNETPDILNDHSRIILAQIKASGHKPGVFVAGTKKDIVISSKLADPARTHHVSIYGWHRLNGKAIQPLYNGHINIYVDYSHGVRLISKTVLIDGKVYDYENVLKDPALYTLLSNEPEPLKVTSYLSK